MVRALWFSILLCLFSVQLSARHIIGGIITYKCLGNGDYEFTMKIYRDCGCTNCADFDNPAAISIFECGGTVPCSSLGQGQQRHRFNVRLQEVNLIEAPTYPCLIPPNVCVQEGIYQWKLSDFRINLPESPNSYHISYQRCCRNITINNINRPDDQGATYWTEITPAAQRLCNSSPVFNEFPPTVICANTPINYDHSATDPDGDRLEYSFCPPLQGGGPILAGNNYNSCQGAQPDPPCPPPYNSVNFIVPAYSAGAPMGGNPVVSIDPNTGQISGIPEIQGQFVVGVCVTEYRNNVALSRVYRDFQFNVANCDPTVVGKIKADEVRNNGREFYIRSCGNRVVPLENQSFQQRYISSYRWEFTIDDQRRIFNDWSPTVTFPDTGLYNGILTLNPGSACGDTVDVIVEVFPELDADFSFDYDTCISGPVFFTDRSIVRSGKTETWEWTFGDGNKSTDTNPVHLYKVPGDLPVTLRITDKNKCTDNATKVVNYFPVPKLIVIAPSAERGCEPLDVYFDNLSFPIDDSYTLDWDFGDGIHSSRISPFHTYQKAGLYTVRLDITSPIGCKTDTTFQDLILVESAPVAAFDYAPRQLNSFNKTVTFIDQSIDASKWSWLFNNTAVSSMRNPVIAFPDTGIQVVRLIVTHPSGCMDTIEQYLDIRPEIRYYLPNAFTPNNDSNNEVFKGVGFLEGVRNFSMNIWNRWGEKIFETTDPNEGWTGQKNNTGEPVPAGVYIVTVSFTGPRGEPHSYKGVATVLR